MQKNSNYHFNKALKYYGFNKKEFAQKCKIPYDTVAGWKRGGHVPEYAFVLLKQLAFLENVTTLKPKPLTKVTLNTRLEKEIQVAFWGKAYDASYVLKEVKKANTKFVKPFFENLYYKDILKLLSIKQIEKLLPVLETQFKAEKILFWENVVKHFTADRLGDLAYIEHADFPRIENYYNLLLYKLKAFCDRTDTVKDMFDIYFLFKVLKPIEIKKLFLDLELKFLETTGYVYSVQSVVNALKIPRRWDIILTEDESMQVAMKKAIEDFQEDFASVLLDAQTSMLDFTYEKYLKDKVLAFDCDTAENYLSFYEKNAFVEQECRKYSLR